MQATNSKEQKKKLLEFSGLYAGSLLLLFVIFKAFSAGPSTATAKTDKPEAPAAYIARQNKEALRTDVIFHQQLKHIEDLDKKYAFLLSNSAALTSIDSIRKAIKQSERMLRYQVDSTVRKHSNGNWSDSLVRNVAAFQAELDNRQTQEDIRDALVLSKIPGIHDRQSELLESKGALLDKDIRIADLESEINSLKNSRRTENGSPASSQTSVDLRKDFDELQKNYQRVTDDNLHLHKINDNLNTQLSNPDPAAKDQMKSAVTKISSLERRIEDLNADLSFATVDCNLSRVDVNQIISNSRQRRALLKQAMDILTYLKGSSNPAIQQTAEEKIEQLSKIISAVRD